jgi:hypothetical protein
LSGEKKRFDGNNIEKKKYLTPPRVAAQSTNSEKMPMKGFQNFLSRKKQKAERK